MEVGLQSPAACSLLHSGDASEPGLEAPRRALPEWSWDHKERDAHRRAGACLAGSGTAQERLLWL